MELISITEFRALLLRNLKPHYENVFDEKCRKAVRYIRDAGGRVAHGVLLKRMHESKEVFKQIIETMEENGTITHEIKGSGPSMTKFYILR